MKPGPQPIISVDDNARLRQTPLSVAIGIATRGRADTLRSVLPLLQGADPALTRVIISHTAPEDVAGLQALPGVEFICGRPGSSVQRNVILEAVTDADILLFLDDDFLMAPGYIAAIRAVFEADPGVVVTTGAVLADGARGPGLSVAEGLAMLPPQAPSGVESPFPCYNGYGCNLAVRMETVRRHGLRFDEHLPLYAWYEDIDFSRNLARFGGVTKVPAAQGVHLGVKSGRQPGLRVGYSQVANPVYIAGKGNYDWSRALRSIGRHVLINGLRSFRPEPWVDRSGRFRGNLLAVRDLLIGRARPERILDL